MIRPIDCESFARLAEREARGEIAAAEFARLDRHRDVCPACAARLREADPLALFGPLASARREPEAWSGLWEGVRAGIHEEGRLDLGESVGLLRPLHRTVLAAAAVVIGMGLVALALPRLLPVPAVPAPAIAAAPVPPEPHRPTVESIQSSGARIYEVKVFGENEQVTELVLIVDREIDL